MIEHYLYLCRHGYRDDDDDELIGNDGLNKYGVAQVKLLAKKLQKFDIDFIMVSPFKRTLASAEIISSALSIPFHIEPLISEWINDEWHSGIPQLEEPEQIIQRYPHAIFQTQDLFIPSAYPETYEAMQGRCKRVAEVILDNERNLLIVTHGIIISHIVAALTKLGPERFVNEISSLTILKHNRMGDWEIKLNNSLEHLQKYTANIRFFTNRGD